MTYEDFVLIVKAYADACKSLSEKARGYGSAFFAGYPCDVEEIGTETVTVSRYGTDYEYYPTAWLFSDTTPEQRRTAIEEGRRISQKLEMQRQQEEADKQERALYERLREKYGPQ